MWTTGDPTELRCPRVAYVKVDSFWCSKLVAAGLGLRASCVLLWFQPEAGAVPVAVGGFLVRLAGINFSNRLPTVLVRGEFCTAW